ncbi:hypothetical protein [Devosia sp.]|uniref:hypothetical protein n=1 Tax=Devosia sp. TaxID=1871048 RepID=UPI002EED5EDD
MSSDPHGLGGPGPSYEDVRHLCGDVADWKISAILATGATLDEINAAIAWEAGEDDVMGGARRPLVGGAAAVYDILIADEDYGDEER